MRWSDISLKYPFHWAPLNGDFAGPPSLRYCYKPRITRDYGCLKDVGICIDQFHPMIVVVFVRVFFAPHFFPEGGKRGAFFTLKSIGFGQGAGR